MAKLNYSKLKLKSISEVKSIEFNGETIEVRTYLPIVDKLALVSNVIGMSLDNPKFVNSIKQDVIFKIEIVKAYTNIQFTEKQLEDAGSLYDELITCGLLSQILEVIGKSEFDYLVMSLNAMTDAIWKYNNSSFGMLEAITDALKESELDLDTLIEKVKDPELLKLVKNVLTKLS